MYADGRTTALQECRLALAKFTSRAGIHRRLALTLDSAESMAGNIPAATDWVTARGSTTEALAMGLLDGNTLIGPCKEELKTPGTATRCARLLGTGVVPSALAAGSNLTSLFAAGIALLGRLAVRLLR